MDIVPTLSLLLGVPIPYSSIGTIVPELFIDTYDGTLNGINDTGKRRKSSEDQKDDRLSIALFQNAFQVSIYYNTYIYIHIISIIYMCNYLNLILQLTYI